MAERIEYLQRLRLALGMRYQKFIDDTTPHTMGRWIASAVCLLIYWLRIWSIGGFYIITYALGIYVLNILLAFLTPQIDPESEEAGGAPLLPTKNDDEFRPFISRLPEFKFWYALTRAFLVAILCTFVGFLDIPVFWPILLLYFIGLFVVTMKKQIRHMIQYRYVPFTTGKKQYRGKVDK